MKIVLLNEILAKEFHLHTWHILASDYIYTYVFHFESEQMSSISLQFFTPPDIRLLFRFNKLFWRVFSVYFAFLSFESFSYAPGER